MKFKIKVHMGYITKSSLIFTPQPILIFRSDAEEVQTTPAQGNQPHWNQQLTITCNSCPKVTLIVINAAKDKPIVGQISNPTIGETEVNLKDKKGPHTGFYSIKNNGVPAGKVKLTIIEEKQHQEGTGQGGSTIVNPLCEVVQNGQHLAQIGNGVKALVSEIPMQNNPIPIPPPNLFPVPQFPNNILAGNQNPINSSNLQNHINSIHLGEQIGKPEIIGMRDQPRYF